MGKHSPKPKTYLYRKYGSRFELVFDESGVGWVPGGIRKGVKWWVNNDGNICEIEPVKNLSQITNTEHTHVFGRIGQYPLSVEKITFK